MKTQIQKLKSSKLFYKKWIYRVECRIGGNEASRYAIRKTMLSVVAPFLTNNQLQIRNEGSHFNIFCNDYQVLETLDAALYKWITKISGPTSQEEVDFLLENGPKKILCDKLPKNDFKYRIYFKYSWAEDKRLNFYTWSEQNKDKIVVSPTSKAWLIGKRKWAQNPFAYIKDDKTLSMVGLQLTGYVKCVEQFVERNKALAT